MRGWEVTKEMERREKGKRKSLMHTQKENKGVEWMEKRKEFEVKEIKGMEE